MGRFLENLATAVAASRSDAEDEENEDARISEAEAEMDAEAKRMDLLNDRIARRIEKSIDDPPDWATIYEEEATRLRRECERPAEASPEHPICELLDGVLFASGKLAGALNGDRNEVWPPDELRAPAVLLFLKKARGYLADARDALDTIDAEGIGESAWRAATRPTVEHLLAETRRLIREVRLVLE